ncbi:MAG: site-specific integrase [Acidobacteria bacterium]|nr:site-specific integrase [Acidobacteriota bacterium]
MAIHKRGSGTVYQRGSIWWIQYFVRGRPVQESSGFEEKAGAENLLKQRIGEVAAGRRTGPERATIADLCALVIEDNRLRKLRDAQHVEWRYKAHIESSLGNLSVSRFGSTQVRQYVAGRRAAGASDATINRELAIIRRGFQLGYEAEPPLVRRLPVIHKLEETNVRQGFLEPDQYETLLDELPARLKALYVCGYHVGARKNELRRIQWPQVDLHASLIRLSADQTKGKRPRTLPIYGDMRRWLERQRETGPAGSPWVFHGANGRPVDNHLYGWCEACERAGLPGLLFHDLRRSAVRNMKRAGIQDVEAMRITGHRTRSIFDRYNIVDEGDLVSAGKRLEEYAQRRKQERAARLVRVK